MPTVKELRETLSVVPEGYTQEQFDELEVIAGVESDKKDFISPAIITELGVTETVPELEGERSHHFFSIQIKEVEAASI